MKAIHIQRSRRWGAQLGMLLVLTLLGPSICLPDPTLRYQRTSNRVERRDDRAGGRIDNRQERSGNRIDRRDDRITNRIDRRDILYSPPAGATTVSVGGAPGYQAGAETYKPAFYEGQTVYVKVEAR